MDIEQEAKLQGWVPQADFKGDESKWVDAGTYVDRGRHIMPILQNNNKRLVSELDSVKSLVEKLNQTVANQSQSMEELKQFHQDSTKAQVEKVRRELLADLKSAKSEGDIDQEIELTSELSKFDAAQKTAKEPKVIVAPIDPATPPQLHPEISNWFAQNTWYGQDDERTGLMDGIARKMKKENSPLTHAAFLDEAARRMNEKLEPIESTRGSKVEGGSRSSGVISSGNISSYSALPSDAKAICDKQGARFVGDDKVYKTKKEWQEFFVSEYNKSN